jgi:hypothetical protein
MAEDNDLGYCEVHLLFHESLAGADSAATAERDDEEGTDSGHLPSLDPTFRQELVRRNEVGFLLAREPRVAQDHSLQTTHCNHSSASVVYMER